MKDNQTERTNQEIELQKQMLFLSQEIRKEMQELKEELDDHGLDKRGRNVTAQIFKRMKKHCDTFERIAEEITPNN
jgi:hypothetical protein